MCVGACLQVGVWVCLLLQLVAHVYGFVCVNLEVATNTVGDDHTEHIKNWVSVVS